MNGLQRFFMAILPRTWAEDMRRESQRWMVSCTCGYERSVWETGGIRWKASGTPQRLMKCSFCGQRTKHRVYKRG